MKRYALLLLTTLIVVACAAPQATAVAPPPASRTPTSARDISTKVPSTPTPAKKIAVKHNDLLFIEFFAIT